MNWKSVIGDERAEVVSATPPSMLRTTVLALLFPIAATAQIDLRPLRFELEQKTRFDVTTMTTLNLGPVGARTELTLRTLVEAVEVDGHKTRLRFTWEHVYGEIAIRFMTVRFDSRKDVEVDDKPAKSFLSRLDRSIVDDLKAPHLALRGFSFDAIVDSRGSIVELPDLAEKLDALRKKLEAGPSPKMVRAFTSEQGLRWQVRLLVPEQPTRGAAVGEKWKSAVVLGLGNSGMGSVESDIQCQLQSTDTKKATIRWSGEPDIGSPKVHVKRGTLKGSQVLSMDDGMPISVDAKFELDVEMMGRLGPVPQKLKCEYEVVRIGD